MPLLPDEQFFRLYTLNRRWSNASLLFRRSFDGHIVSMQQSGTHWLKNMLAHIQDDSIIGHTKSPPVYKNIPQIVHSHGYPHALTLRLPVLHYPRYLVLLRDLRDSLISHYERFNVDYNVDFATYLRGDIRQKKFRSDIYSRIRYMNEWGDVLLRAPERTALLRYEDLRKDTEAELLRVAGFLGIAGVTAEVAARAIAATTRDKMAQKPNPDVKTTVVRTEHKPVSDYFTPENQAIFDDICARYLRHGFGYGYAVQKAA